MENFTFEELVILTDYHLKYYRSHLKRQAFIESEGWSVHEAFHRIPLEKAYAYTINCALERLNEDERRILTKEFVENQPKNWWMEYYSKSTYYRFKHRACARFIHCLHHEIVV